jgi:hypothetical protein
VINIFQICLGTVPLPSLRSGPTGKIFTRGRPPGEGRCTVPQGLVLWSWNPNTLFILLNRCWVYIFQVYLPRNKYMRTYFVFSCTYAIFIDVSHFRGSNKWGNLFIYTPKYVLNTLVHFSIIGAKVRGCSTP